MRREPSPKRRWKSLLAEPLVVFLVLGLLVFALERARRGSLDSGQRRIEITSGEIARLEELWSAQSGRLPTESELDSLIENAIEEEVLVREARLLGLDREDTIVRRRLAQKMSFLVQDRAEVGAPSDRDLDRFFERSVERYVEPERTTFSHIYWSDERREGSASEEAERVLAELEARAPDPAEWRRLGDPFLLNREYAERTGQEIGELFGRSFAESLRQAPVGSWSGPMASAYGQHLVRVMARTEERQLALDEVRSRVIKDYRSERRREANREALTELRNRYRVEVERGAGGPAASGDAPAARP